MGNLYKPMSEFEWKDASDEEIKADSLPHYKEKLNKTKCVLIEVSAVRNLSEKAVLVIENLNIKTPIPKSAYFGRGDSYFDHWVAEWVLPQLKREYEIKDTKFM